MINELNIEKLKSSYSKSRPFNYVIIDNFWEKRSAHLLVSEIESMSLSENVTNYKSPLEKKTIITMHLH